MIWSTPAVEALAESLGRSTGLDFPPSRAGFADVGIRRVLARVGERDLAALLARLEHDRALFQAFVAEVTVGETYFFRDEAQFEVLRSLVVPEIVARSTGAPLRVWSAGCSTGEEPYSLAIRLDELGQHDARIVATDVCAAAIATARRGRYPARSFRDGIDPATLPAFTRAGKDWLIDERLRRRVTFTVDNLIDPQPGDERFDVIVCRNVLIYFSPAAVARAADALIDRLAPGGWLITSATDPILQPRDGVEQLMTGAGIFYRYTRSAAAHAHPELVEGQRQAVQSAVIRRPPQQATPSPDPRLACPERRRTVGVTGSHADAHVAAALDLLDRGHASEALVEARRARYLDRTCPVAHLAFGRALRLSGRCDAARRALRRSRRLLAQHPLDEPLARAGGLSAGALAAIVAAELHVAARVRTLR